jgi:hypothetical protein
MATLSAKGDPTKDFFVFMITRDISLEDCIFDLIDNSIDGARKSIATKGKKAKTGKSFFKGFSISITISPDKFRIEDNGSGISVEEAKNYAFRFGRKHSSQPDAQHGIGLYGIGMKRAVFKLGNGIAISSSTDKESFSSNINVRKWLKEDKTWDFPLEAGRPSRSGTQIEVVDLHEEVSKRFSDPSFSRQLATVIARDYSLILQDGLVISLNGKSLPAFVFKLLDGGDFKPLNREYVDVGVRVQLVVGLSRIPTDDGDPSDARRHDDEYSGWFVVCNERVVIASDKTRQTVWEDDGFQEWHGQYNGFLGILFFDSDDPRELPWTTTKRGIEQASPLYRRAVAAMKDATQEFIKYTNARRAHIDEAKGREVLAKATPISDVKASERLITPKFEKKLPQVRMSTISYQKPTSKVDKVKKALGNAFMSNKDVGISTFDYYAKQELDQ